jgi:hypothetical protein
METAKKLFDAVKAKHDETAVGLPPGIYFGLDEETYHRDPALGSSDLRAIDKNVRMWWLGSKRNPNVAQRERYRVSTNATKVGAALHKYVLEGRDAFGKAYVRRPDDPPNATPSDKGAVTKEFNKKLAASGDPRKSLHGDEWSLCEETMDIITGHPDLEGTFASKGVNEVSVFWRRPDGVMCKARFDRLTVYGLGDLKSIENERRLRLDIAARNDIASYRIDMQLEHYLEARSCMRFLPAFTMKGDYFDKSEGQLLEFASACAGTEFHWREKDGTVRWSDDHLDQGDDDRYAMVVIFIQKSSPDVWAQTFTPGNPMLDLARVHLERAFSIYKTAKIDTRSDPPPPVWRLREAAIEEMPAWYGRE